METERIVDFAADHPDLIFWMIALAVVAVLGPIVYGLHRAGWLREHDDTTHSTFLTVDGSDDSD